MTGDGDGNLAATFRVGEVIKGSIRSEVAVRTSAYATACGYPFETGKTYLIYAFRESEASTKTLTTGTCTGTKRLDLVVPDEIEILRSLRRGRFEPRIYGEVRELLGGISPLPLRDTAPMQGVKVIAEGAGHGRETVTDQTGNFRFTDLDTGTYRVRAVPPENYRVGGDYWEDPTGEAKPFTEIRITPSECSGRVQLLVRVDGRIAGQVFDSTGRCASKGVRVSLLSAERSTSDNQNAPYIPAYTDDRGQYEFRGLPEGKYLLGINLDVEPHRDNPYPRTFWSRQNQANQPEIIPLAFGQKLTGYDLRLPPAIETQVVEGRVVLESGRPAREVLVFVGNRARSDFEDLMRVSTDSMGQFRAECLRGRRYRFRAQGTERGPGSSEEIEVLVEPGIPPISLVLKSDRRMR